MRRLLKALERAGLVETDQSTHQPALSEMHALPNEYAAEPELPRPAREPRPAPLAEARGLPESAQPASSDPGEAPSSVQGHAEALAEARAFDEIYAESELPHSPFPAERLLRVLDGLNALEPAARKMAVVALDSADDSWSVDDSLLDAERKVRVLERYRSQIEDQTRALLAEGKAAAEAREQQHEETAARIRQQIADLEALLERDVARASQDKERIYSEARASREACTRETARVDEEIQRLRRISEIFSEAPSDNVVAAP